MMKMWSRCILAALASLGLVSAAHSGTYGADSAAPAGSPPPGYTLCVANGKVCRVTPASATAYVAYGGEGQFKFAKGTGDFSCLPKGFVKFPSAKAPQDLGIDDPRPGKAEKSCYVKVDGGKASADVGAPPPPPAKAATSTYNAAAWCKSATPSTPNNCTFTSGSPAVQRGGVCPSQDACGCRCAANMGKSCTYNGSSIAKPVCRPGQYPGS